MASNRICASCLRSLRQQARRHPQSSTRHQANNHPHRISAFASFTTSHKVFVESTTNKPTKPPPPPRDPIASFAASLRKQKTLQSTTEPYLAYGGTEDLFHQCSAQCSYTIPAVLKQPPEPPPKTALGEDIGDGTGWWYASPTQRGLGLDVTFNNWAQVLFLHMYMLTVRLRCFPAEHARVWHQNLLDHFFYAAEDRMATWHGMAARGIRNRHLKELLQQWRGILLSYDEGLIKGDAVLAAAIWRNLFKADVETSVQDVALVTAYMKAQLAKLAEMSDESISAGDVRFGDPASYRKLVERQSEAVRKPLPSTVEEEGL